MAGNRAGIFLVHRRTVLSFAGFLRFPRAGKHDSCDCPPPGTGGSGHRPARGQARGDDEEPPDRRRAGTDRKPGYTAGRRAAHRAPGCRADGFGRRLHRLQEPARQRNRARRSRRARDGRHLLLRLGADRLHRDHAAVAIRRLGARLSRQPPGRNADHRPQGPHRLRQRRLRDADRREHGNRGADARSAAVAQPRGDGGDLSPDQDCTRARKGPRNSG